MAPGGAVCCFQMRRVAIRRGINLPMAADAPPVKEDAETR
jgi:hypothetical protein